jgi:hypothetical protein
MGSTAHAEIGRKAGYSLGSWAKSSRAATAKSRRSTSFLSQTTDLELRYETYILSFVHHTIYYGSIMLTSSEIIFSLVIKRPYKRR